MGRVFIVFAAVVLAACRDGSRVQPDDVGKHRAQPAPPPATPIASWSELAPLLEPCVKPGRSAADTTVHVQVIRGAGQVLRVSCVGDYTDGSCIERAIESATYAPGLATSDEALFITRRVAAMGPVQFGPVRVRTWREMAAVTLDGGVDVQISNGPCD